MRARLPSVCLLGGGSEEFVHEETYWFFCAHGSSENVNHNNLDCGRERIFKVLLTQLRAPVMDKERWSTRWKTKKWLRNSAITAIISLTFVLQTAHVSAGTWSVLKRRRASSPAFHWCQPYTLNVKWVQIVSKLWQISQIYWLCLKTYWGAYLMSIFPNSEFGL